MSKLICSFDAILFENLQHVIGKFSIYEISSVHYVLKFKSDNKDDINKVNEVDTVNKSIHYVFDIEDLEFCDNNDFNSSIMNCFQIYDDHADAFIKFCIQDMIEFNYFVEAISYCREVCDMTLRLHSLVRDVYHSGIYANLKRDENIHINNELDNLAILDKSKPYGIFVKPEPVLLSIPSIPSPPKSKVDIRSTISCMYCKIDMLSNEFLCDYVQHPYVPNDFEGKSIYFCMNCLTNWKDFRENCEREGQLILPDEVNEELCSLCSDTPNELIMCSYCPRSYCNECLKRSLTSERYNKIATDDDWKCMCCATSVKLLKPSLNVENWKVIKAKPQSPRKTSSPKLSFNEMHMDTISQPVVEEYVPTLNNFQQNKITRRVGRPRLSDSLNSKFFSPINSKTQNEVVIDEYFYFQQYLLFYDSYCKECTSTSVPKRGSEDTCFLCKDGGDLVECDWKYRGKKSVNCKKVYHMYCLSYEIEDDKKFFCAKHFCDCCGESSLAYSCLYCPMSICSKCPEIFVEKYGCKRYIAVPTPNSLEFMGSNVTTIVCQNCIDVMNNLKSSTDENVRTIVNEIFKNNKLLKFPGIIGDNCIGLFQKLDPINQMKGKGDEISVNTSSKKASKNRFEAIEEKSPNRYKRWSEVELQDLEVAAEKHGSKLVAMLRDKSLSLSFKHHSNIEIETKLNRILKEVSPKPKKKMLKKELPIDTSLDKTILMKEEKVVKLIDSSDKLTLVARRSTRSGNEINFTSLDTMPETLKRKRL